MEEHEILEKLYELARKKYPDLKRELLFSDFKGEVLSEYMYYRLPEEEFDEFGRLLYRSEVCRLSKDETEAISSGLRQTPNLTREFLKANGFSSLTPSIREFVGKHGLEYELEMFTKLYSKKIRISMNEGFREHLDDERRNYEKKINELKEKLEW